MSQNPFDVDEDDSSSKEILEGFLCPICREDLKSLEFLTDHFERTHSEEQDALKSLKDIFTKAKKKIGLNNESFDLARNLEKNLSIAGGSTTSSIGSNLSNAHTRTNVYNFMSRQEVGVEVDHFEYFQSIRNPRLERYATETNKLIIRLHKLLKDMPIDPVQRKQHEQKTVPWLDGSSVKLCPNCAKSFHIARRQHHCRLCGSIMCNDCSKSLPIQIGLELATLTMAHDDQPAGAFVDEHGTTNTNKMHMDGIRCCDHCLWLLETRQAMHESRTCRPSVTQLYDEIQQLRKDVFPKIETYLKIVASLYDGESIFTISDASNLRGKILQIAEVIDLRSKRIMALPCQEGSREAALNKVLRISCIQLIKEHMLTLPPLPTEEEIHKIQARKRMEAEQRIQTERRQALEAYERCGVQVNDSPSSNHGGSYVHGSDVRSLDNWSAHHVSAAAGIANHDDPLVEQINIIKGYIKQARQELNFDVVETLELNLRELQREFYERQKSAALSIRKNSDARASSPTAVSSSSTASTEILE